jgi:hypothetical protein
MEKHQIVTLGTTLVSIFLVVSFFLILLLGTLSSRDVLVHLTLLILTVVSLAIFSEVSRIAYILGGKKK